MEIFPLLRLDLGGRDPQARLVVGTALVRDPHHPLDPIHGCFACVTCDAIPASIGSSNCRTRARNPCGFSCVLP